MLWKFQKNWISRTCWKPVLDISTLQILAPFSAMGKVQVKNDFPKDVERKVVKNFEIEHYV